MRILITAFTHAAIDNLLSTIEFVKEQFSLSPQFDRAHHLSQNLQILKLDSKNVHSVSSIRSSIVVGSTVWKLEKLPPSVLFDVILVDESTQLLTCDSALPLNRLVDHVQSKLIVAGDPLQLPPIKRASYPALPDSQPDIFSSLFHCLLRDAQNRRITLESDDPSEEMRRCPYLVVFNENHRKLNRLDIRLRDETSVAHTFRNERRFIRFHSSTLRRKLSSRLSENKTGHQASNRNR